MITVYPRYIAVEDRLEALRKLAKLKLSILILVIIQYIHNYTNIIHAASFIKGVEKEKMTHRVRETIKRLLVHGSVKRVRRGEYVLTKRGLKKIKYYWLIKKEIPEEFVSEQAKEVEIKVRVGDKVYTL